ncbi:MAG TPA: hypothetical protein VFD58_29835 [Blastocatellia bacterium]|nr:hypothetical protein [Blastocatellia bacterium]
MKWLPGKRARRSLTGLAVIVAVCLIVFFSLPRLLIAPSHIVPAEAILHYAIDPHSDADAWVAGLYRQGLVKKIVCVSRQASWELYPADFVRRHLIELGVPADDVLTLHLPMVDCMAQNLPRMVEFVKSQGWQNVVLLGRPADSRADGRLAKKYFAGAGVNAVVTYVPQEARELTDHWWAVHWKAQTMVDAAATTTLDLAYPECW